MKSKVIFLVCVLVYLFFTACNTSASKEPDGMINIKYNEFHQEIDGFGGSDAWLRMPYDKETAQELTKLLYSKTEGMGFTILRNRIPFRERLENDENPGYNDGFVMRNRDGTYIYTQNADGSKTFELNWDGWDMSGTREFLRHIRDLGENGPENLVIMSTPWTPPNNRVTRWKEDVKGVSGKLDYTIDWSRPDVWGRLRRDKYNDYADLLADYVKNYESMMGFPLSILSVQNEPNWKVEYESAYWNGEDLRDFIKVIGQRFPMKGIKLGSGGIGIMAPEYENYNVSFKEMIKPMLDDPESEKVLSHIGLHQYNSGYDSSLRAGTIDFPEINASGKRFWQTEVSGSGPNMPAGTGIDNALFYARMIHFNMIQAQTNAYLYWWLWTSSSNDDNFPGSLVMVDFDEIITSKRLYAIGQYSRFIRPGWVRIACDTNPVRGRSVFSSAYRNPKTNEVAVVFINETAAPVTVSMNITDTEFNNLEIWKTSANESLERSGNQKVSRNTAEVVISPKAIVTVYGTVK